jgi:hypothetical protein
VLPSLVLHRRLGEGTIDTTTLGLLTSVQGEALVDIKGVGDLDSTEPAAGQDGLQPGLTLPSTQRPP